MNQELQLKQNGIGSIRVGYEEGKKSENTASNISCFAGKQIGVVSQVVCQTVGVNLIEHIILSCSSTDGLEFLSDRSVKSCSPVNLVNLLERWKQLITGHQSSQTPLVFLKQCLGFVSLTNTEFILLCYNFIKHDQADVLEIMLDEACKSGTPIYFPDAEKQSTILHYAAKFGSHQCVDVLIYKAPWLLVIDNKEGSCPIHLAAEHGNLECLQRFSEIDGQINRVNYCDQLPIHFAAYGGHLSCVKFIIEKFPAQLNKLDTSGCNVLDHALRGNSKNAIECIRYFINKKPELIVNFRREFDGPIANAITSSNVEVLALFLEQDCIIPWFRYFRFLEHIINLVNHYASEGCRAECSALIIKALDKAILEHQPVDGFSIKRYLYHYNQIICRPNHLYNRMESDFKLKKKWFLPDTSSRSIDILNKAEALLAGLDNVGVYGYIKIYKDYVDGNEDRVGQFWSLGDISASIQMLHALIELGAKKINFWFSTDADADWMDEEGCDVQSKVPLTAIGKKYFEKRKIASSVLSYLLGVDLQDTDAIQTINIGDACVKILRVTGSNCQQECSPVTFSFSGGINKYPHECWPMSRHFIVIKPYRFHNSSQYIMTNICNNDSNIFFLDLSVNSVIPIADLSTKSPPELARYVGASVQTLSNVSEMKLPSSKGIDFSGASVIEALCTKGIGKQVHISLVYGLHHHHLHCSELRERILSLWIQAIKAQLNAVNDSRPVVIAIFPNTEEWKFLSSIASGNKIKLIDITDDTALSQVQILSPGDIALGIMPSLPRSVFDHLVVSSNLPVLAEGANLTSFLLQHGRPHLSLLPEGKTPVAQDMGDPLEAMKAQAFSYKLKLDEAELDQLNNLLNYLKAKEYKQAVELIDDIRSKYKSYINLKLEYRYSSTALRFLWKELNPYQDLRSAPVITVEELLKKARDLEKDNKSLSGPCLEALISSVDPSSEAMASYIGHCMDKNSRTFHHFKLMQMHVRQPFNNAIARALVAFGHKKKLIL